MEANERLKSRPSLALALALCGLGLSACSSTTVIKTAEQPALRTGSALKSIKPLRLCLKDFQDLRGTEPDLIFAFGSKRYRLDKPVIAWVRASLCREFERDGHKCVGPDRDTEADVVMDGSVYRYSLDMHFGQMATRCTGDVGVKISVRAAKNPEVVFTRKYDGSYYSTGFGLRVSTAVRIQNEALLNMIKELTTDPEFLDFLRRTGETETR